MKRLFLVVISIIIAGAIYVVGCGLIDRATATQPDWVGTLREQPKFTNTIYP